MMMTVKMMGVFIGSRGPLIYCTSSSSAQAVLTTIYNEACAFSRYKTRSNWLILRTTPSNKLIKLVNPFFFSAKISNQLDLPVWTSL